MKATWIALGIVVFAGQAAAEQNTIGTHFVQAYRAFAMSSDHGVSAINPDADPEAFLKDLLNGLDGTWVYMSRLPDVKDSHADPSEIVALSSKICVPNPEAKNRWQRFDGSHLLARMTFNF